MAANAEPLEAREPSHSGRLLLRMPRKLHAELAARSDAEGVSLNQFIVAALSRAASGEAPQGGGAQPARMSSTLRVALIVNAVVVAIAAGTAIALLVIAWH
jgi:HicB-like protein involved in pilus formation